MTDSIADVAVGRAITGPGPDRDACSHTQTIYPRRKVLMQQVPRFIPFLTSRVQGPSTRAANHNLLRDIVLEIAEQRGLGSCWEWMSKLELGKVSDPRLPDSARGEISKDLNFLINALHIERWGPPIKEISAAELKFEQEQRLQAWRSRISALGERERQQRNDGEHFRQIRLTHDPRNPHCPVPVLTPLEQRMQVAFDRLLDRELEELVTLP